MATANVLQTAIQMLDPHAFGIIDTKRKARAAWVRIVENSGSKSSDELAWLLSKLWMREEHLVVISAIEDWLPRKPWPEQALSQLLQTLSELWSAGQQQCVVDWVEASKGIIQPECTSQFWLDAAPFSFTLALALLAKDSQYHTSLVSLLKIGQMLSEDRIDRALDHLYDLEKRTAEGDNTALFESWGTSHWPPIGYYWSNEKDQIVRSTIEVVRNGRIKTGFSCRVLGGGIVSSKLVVRCLPCFFDWCRSLGLQVEFVEHGLQADGLEHWKGVLRSDRNEAIARWNVEYLGPVMFLRQFAELHEKHWEFLFVPEDERETEDDARRELCVAVGPMTVDSDESWALQLGDYRGKYHGRITQRAVQAYRRYALDERHWTEEKIDGWSPPSRGRWSPPDL